MFKYYKDPVLVALLVFGIVDGLIQPFFITCIMSKLSASIIAIQAISYSAGSIFSNYISEKFDKYLKQRKYYYGIYIIDFVITYLIIYLYWRKCISLDLLYLFSNVSFAVLGGILTNQNEYIKTDRYSGENKETTANNIQKLSAVNRYYNHFAIMIGCGLGLYASFIWKDVNIINLWLFNNTIYLILLIAKLFAYELWRKGV
jgi:hypothetical protein